jgi:signal transduction histidine kinase
VTRFGIAIVVLGSTLLFSVYGATRGLMPDPQANQRVLSVFLRSFLADARIQREVLQAQVGVAVNYDTLNEQIAALRAAWAEFGTVATAANGPPTRNIGAALNEFREAVATQEDLVERFKSTTALMQNSNRIFSYVAGQFGGGDAPGGDTSLSTGILQSALSLTTYAHHPDPETERAARAALDALTGPRPDDRLTTLRRHGTLLIELIPKVDDLTARLERPELFETISLLRNRYLRAYAERERSAGRVQILLLVGALALAVYNIALLSQLARGSHRLRQRLSLEQGAATISRRLLSLPWKRTSEGIVFGLEQLVTRIGADEGRMLVVDRSGRLEAAYRWPVTAAVPTVPETLELFERGAVDADGTGHLSEATGMGTTRSLALLRFSLVGAGGSDCFLILARNGLANRDETDDRMLLALVGDVFRSALERLRQELERQRLETQLARAQRLEILGTLASSVAHEFSNILGGIRGHAELAEDKLPRGGATRGHVAQILIGSARAQAVIDKILSFGRRRSDHRHPFDASEALTEALALLHASVPRTVSFRLAAEPDIRLAGDVTEFQQIVLNLCTNAVHAMEGEGEIVLAFAPVDLEGSLRLSHAELPAARYARLSVEDRGRGIPPSVMERIFEPFFTTKGSGVGTGLGLSTVHDIVASWQGGIDVSSAPGQGTAVRIYLPVVTSDGREAIGARRVRGNGEAVLLVEGNRDRLQRDEEIIAALGYEPIGFSDIDQALAALRSQPTRFRAAIVEQHPDFGPRGLRAFTSLGSGVPIIGLIDRDLKGGHAELHGLDGRGVVKVPLRTSDLADVLAQAISTAA